jgi:hypothetical protein
MKIQIPHHVFVVRKLPRSVPIFIEYVRTVLAAMATSPHFPGPSPSLATVTASVGALESAQATTKTRAPGSTEVRDAALALVIGQVQLLLGYVQQVADGSPEQAAAIIASAGLRARAIGARNKPPFVVRLGALSGTARLVAKAAGGRAAYDWEYSVDGGKTWSAATTTLQATTVIAGLPVAAMVVFRFRSVIKGGAGDWSQPVSLLVR